MRWRSWAVAFPRRPPQGRPLQRNASLAKCPSRQGCASPRRYPTVPLLRNRQAVAVQRERSTCSGSASPTPPSNSLARLLPSLAAKERCRSTLASASLLERSQDRPAAVGARMDQPRSLLGSACLQVLLQAPSRAAVERGASRLPQACAFLHRVVARAALLPFRAPSSGARCSMACVLLQGRLQGRAEISLHVALDTSNWLLASASQ